jgi:CRISPR-associated endonuclease/helicase Cas3
VWAKPDYPLERHTRDCLRLLDVVKRFKGPIAIRVANQAKIEVNALWESSFLALILHDIGKATIPFQKYIRCEGKKESHAFISFYFANAICGNETCLRLDGYPAGLEALAVASHHSPLHASKFEAYNGNEDKPLILENVVERFLANFVSEKFQKFVRRPLSWKVGFPKTYHEIYEDFDIANSRLRRARTVSNESIRLPFAFLKTILHYCDWYGSALDFSPQYSPSLVASVVMKHLREEQGRHVKLRTFQERSQIADDAILQAPTGTGKTEAGLLWADKFMDSRKLIYLLPTMTTSNKIHDRLSKILGCEVGLLHGTSDYMLRVNEEHETQEEGRSMRPLLFSKSFIYPCTVATADQLLFTTFNWGRWELKLMNAGNSAIIVDEIHAYEPYTVALIVETLKGLRTLGAKCFIMSATIPAVLRKFLLSELRLAEVPRDTSFDGRVRVSISLRLNDEITSAIPSVLRYYQDKKKILIICNTVATSKAVFRILRKEKSVRRDTRFLLNSQFIMRERRIKENFLEELKNRHDPFILVATQVVEVSLNIDFDVLFTESCPIDALIQRLGRVNRYGKPTPASVFIFKQTSNADKVYDPKLVQDSIKQLGSKFGSKPKEIELMQMVDNVYQETDYKTRFEQELTKAQTVIADVQDNLRYLYRLTTEEKMLNRVVTRESDYVTINVVPKKFETAALNLPKVEGYKRIEYTVKVPYYRVIGRLNSPVEGVMVADVGYDKELGVIYPESETEAYIN